MPSSARLATFLLLAAAPAAASQAVVVPYHMTAVVFNECTREPMLVEFEGRLVVVQNGGPARLIHSSLSGVGTGQDSGIRYEFAAADTAESDKALEEVVSELAGEAKTITPGPEADFVIRASETVSFDAEGAVADVAHRLAILCEHEDAPVGGDEEAVSGEATP